MKELSEDEVQLVVRALQHYAAYLHATQRQDLRYQELAERLQRKGPGKEEAGRTAGGYSLPVHFIVRLEPLPEKVALREELLRVNGLLAPSLVAYESMCLSRCGTHRVRDPFRMGG